MQPSLLQTGYLLITCGISSSYETQQRRKDIKHR